MIAQLPHCVVAASVFMFCDPSKAMIRLAETSAVDVTLTLALPAATRQLAWTAALLCSFSFYDDVSVTHLISPS